jgi:RNA polymerase II elongation factor ELL
MLVWKEFSFTNWFFFSFRERIIHLLAVRPFKKPELIIRINRGNTILNRFFSENNFTLIIYHPQFVSDGIREKDRKNITVLLKQVSFMKDNTYHLIRHMWNDVSEDWPFYSEQEKQSLKRRKPQNLTPPCSDGSTSSSGNIYCIPVKTRLELL